MVTFVGSRNDRFQRWQTLLTNRTKRHRAGEFLVQGVRPITVAVQRGWQVRALLGVRDQPRSTWAAELWRDAEGERIELTAELMAELADKTDGATELLAVLGIPADDLDRIELASGPVLVFDRPTQPGNIGTLIRSVDAFGGAGLVVTGHAADPYDPKAVRASTGSIFGPPVVRVESHREVLDWVAGRCPVWGTDESAEHDLSAVDLSGPALIVIGNETRGLTRAWRESCDSMLSIPMSGTASSLNAATAGSVLLYEAARQRRG